MVTAKPVSIIPIEETTLIQYVELVIQPLLDIHISETNTLGVTNRRGYSLEQRQDAIFTTTGFIAKEL